MRPIRLETVVILDEGCQIQGSKVCNMTVPSILDQFPSLQGCMCAWEEEPCTSLDVLTTQCHQKPVYDSAGSCTKQMTACIHDKVCNRYLVHLVQACDADPCNDTHCRRATQQFYGDMPRSVAEMLFMCECESWDQSCLLMKNTLHSGTCGDEIRACQEGVIRCLGDRHCRTLLKTFQSKCWNDEDSQCSDSDDRNHECISQMDPALILSADVECRMAFLATVGTALQHPCTCRGLYDEDLRQCNTLNELLHNRSHFRR
ncbi:GDNF family receptor alpha-like [Polymixia lowei]